MKTRRSGSTKGWAARQTRRRAATSGRSCSLALSDFFERQAEPVDGRPHRAAAQPDTVLDLQPPLHRRQRHVRMHPDMRSQRRLLLRRQLARAMAARRIGARLAGGPAPDQRLVDVGDADPEQRCGRAHRHPSVNRRQNP